MEKEPLLLYSSPRRHQLPPPPITFYPLPDEIPMTPKEFKEKLIFGSSPRISRKDLKSNFEALNFNGTSGSPRTCVSPSSNQDPKSNLDHVSWLNPNHPSKEKKDSPRISRKDLKSNFEALNFNGSPRPSLSPSSNQDPKSNLDHVSWLNPNHPSKEKKEPHHHVLHRSRTAPAMATINDIQHHSASPKQPQFLDQSIVRQSVVLLAIYLTLGVAIYSFFRENFSASETHPVVDALYFCIVTMCTIGYGDITPSTPATKLFAILFVLVGFGFIDILLSGMVGYVLDLQENYLIKTVKSQSSHDPGSYLIDFKKGRMRIRMKVALALGVVVLCIGIGVAVMHFVERLGWLDSLYLSVMSVTTVGYGDRAFKSLPGRIFASIWLLVSTLAVARAFLYLAEARVDKRHRRLAKWVLDQDMTVAQFLAADIDNNGFVSKSEYVIYKLKEMEKISEKDIMPICKQFDRLDTSNHGKITLADLMDPNH